MTRVLLIGFTAEASDLTNSPLDVDGLREVIDAGNAAVEAAGYEVVHGWIGTDHEASVAEVQRLLSSTSFDIVLIGGGIRGHQQFTELFERLVNLAHTAAPKARFAFNADPPSSLQAVERNS